MTEPTDLLLDHDLTTLGNTPVNSFFYRMDSGSSTKVYQIRKKNYRYANEYYVQYVNIENGKEYGSIWRDNKSMRRAYTAAQAVAFEKVEVIERYLNRIKHHPHHAREGINTEYLKTELKKLKRTNLEFPPKSDIVQGLTKGPITIIKEGKGKTTMNTNKLNSVISMAQAKRGMFVVATAQFEEGGKEYHFKLPSTLAQVVKAGDYVVAENRNGSWNKAVVKVTEVKNHADLPYDAHEGPWAWIIAKVGVNAFEIMKESEQKAIKTLKAQAARKSIIDDLDVSMTDAISAVDNS